MTNEKGCFGGGLGLRLVVMDVMGGAQKESEQTRESGSNFKFLLKNVKNSVVLR